MSEDLQLIKVQTAIDWLTFRSYEHNRNLYPDKSPEKWGKIYTDADLYEEIYQSKKSEDQK